MSQTQRYRKIPTTLQELEKGCTHTGRYQVSRPMDAYKYQGVWYNYSKDAIRKCTKVDKIFGITPVNHKADTSPKQNLTEITSDLHKEIDALNERLRIMIDIAKII